MVGLTVQGTWLTLLEEGRKGEAKSGESLWDGALNSLCNRQLGDVDFNAVTSESVLFLPAASSYPTAEIEKALGPRDEL